MKKEIYTKNQTANIIGISYTRLTQEMLAGKIEGFKIKGEGNIIYFTAEEIRRYQQKMFEKKSKNTIVAIAELGFKERLKKVAGSKGIDLNSYILSSLKERIEKDERE